MALRTPIFLIILGLALSVQAQDPLHRRFTMQHGLPSNTVYRSMQDRDGFVWFGTDAGAVRFDGKSLDRFGLEEGVADEDVFAVYTDTKGRIWFLTANGLPCYLERGVVHSWRNDPVLARIHLRSGIHALHEDDRGTIWFGGLRGELAKLHSDGRVVMRKFSDEGRPIPGGVISFHPTASGGVQVFDGGWPVDLDGRILGGMVGSGQGMGMFQTHEQRRLMHAANDSVSEWDGEGWVTLLHRDDLPGRSTFFTAFPLGDDELWVSLRSGGVLWLQRLGERWMPMRDVMFKGDLISYVMRDREGRIWLSTAYGGFILVNAEAMATAFYTGSRAGNEEFLRAHACDQLGVWVGTSQGELYRLGKGLELLDLPPEGPIFSRVSCIRSHDGDLLVATEHRSFRVFEAESEPRIEELGAISTPKERFFSNIGLKAIAGGPKGRVVGSMYGLMELSREEKVFRLIKDPAIPTVRIYAPHFDAQGTLWFEENGLLYSQTREGFRSHPDLALETGYRITDITSVGDTLLIATNGKGIQVLVGQRVLRRITQADGLSSDHVVHLFAHGAELFVTTGQGADRISGPLSSPRIHAYTTGLSGPQDRVRDVVADNTFAYVLFANGLMRLPRNEEGTTPSIPLPYIRSVLLNDSLLPGRSIVGIQRYRDRLVVELGAIHFISSEGILMQYRLDPRQDWLQVLGGSIDLSAMHAGQHLLQVRASYGDGPWSGTVELQLVVVPPLWERWWAIALFVLVVTALVFVVLRILANRRYKQRVKQLRHREELSLARQRIAMDLHDDLGAELSSILLLTRMERERPTPGSLERVEQLMGGLTEKVKEVIWSTDPGLDTLESTLTFIQRYAIKLCGRHGLRVRTTIPPEIPKVELTAATRRDLYLIAKEAVNNVVKHAHATAFTLTSTVEKDMLILEFADDGQGWDMHGEEGAGHGMRNMAQRASAIDATLAITSVRPHGTRITMRMPLAPVRPNR